MARGLARDGEAPTRGTLSGGASTASAREPPVTSDASQSRSAGCAALRFHRLDPPRPDTLPPPPVKKKKLKPINILPAPLGTPSPGRPCTAPRHRPPPPGLHGAVRGRTASRREAGLSLPASLPSRPAGPLTFSAQVSAASDWRR